MRGACAPGAPAVAPGAECARSLDTCPTPSWCPATSPEPSCSGGRRLGALGDGEGRWLGGHGRRRGGLCDGELRVHWGYAGAGPGRVSEGSCIVGRAPREDGRRSGWSAHSPASSVGTAGSKGAAWRLPRDGAEEAGIGRERGHLWKAFVRHPQWEVPPLFRIQHPQSRPARTPRSMLRGSVGGTGWFC